MMQDKIVMVSITVALTANYYIHFYVDKQAAMVLVLLNLCELFLHQVNSFGPITKALFKTGSNGMMYFTLNTRELMPFYLQFSSSNKISYWCQIM